MFRKSSSNRGEIFGPIIRACRKWYHGPVYSSPMPPAHVQLADESVYRSGGSAKSYLNIPNSAAEVTTLEAIHPATGSGENAHFAEICRLPHQSSVPASKPSKPSETRTGQENRRDWWTYRSSGKRRRGRRPDAKAARQVGYPVIIKAVAGGGGRGMRIAHTEASLLNALHTAQAEAEKAFGNSQVYIEKYLEDPRHVEFQIIADEHGNVFHLGERDCTIQRRHQKLLEEAPSPIMTEALREKMGEAVVRGAKAVNYTSLGTMEFLIDKHGNFYFMEVNTRIQVEHPVTELD